MRGQKERGPGGRREEERKKGKDKWKGARSYARLISPFETVEALGESGGEALGTGAFHEVDEADRVGQNL
jgi:hypothetical protein